MAYRLSFASLATLGILSMGATNCGGGGGGPQCPPRSSESALMIVRNVPGISLAVGSVKVTEVDGLVYVDVVPDQPYIALLTLARPSDATSYGYDVFTELVPEWADRRSDVPLQGAVFERPNQEFTIDMSVDIFRQLEDGRLELVGRIDQAFDFDASSSAAGATSTGGGGGGGPENCPRQ